MKVNDLQLDYKSSFLLVENCFTIYSNSTNGVQIGNLQVPHVAFLWSRSS